MAALEPLTLTVSRRGTSAVLRATGRIDVETAPQLRQRLVELQHSDLAAIEIDLDAVELVDTFGIGVLHEAARRASSSVLTIRCHRQRLVDLLREAGIDRMVSVSSDDATAAGS